MLQDFAEGQDYQLGERLYHADDHAVAQYYIALREKFGFEAAIGPTRAAFDAILAEAPDVALTWDPPSAQPPVLNRSCFAAKKCGRIPPLAAAHLSRSHGRIQGRSA